ncbi:hypothetical protein [Actinokineospora bangkokensis]|uniref:DUF3618 domain-containing protein n=1 Tax=Actinokineospora bangkokensis TaxID=1193682 RepID=A0A1Q9LMI5_9PSEU|nr:hypothetical protein [Actinokineospora bangkokensis]OLR93209.1 hypothetical protein BJP25_17090 [Actinokineospora bangkokensis]
MNHPTHTVTGQDGRSTDGAGGVTDRAADAASSVAESGAQVASTAKDKAADVLAETKGQAANLAGDVQQRLAEEARTQTGRAGELLRGWADDLSAMAERSEQDSPARTAVLQLSQHGKQFADRLSGDHPEEVLQDVRAFARRRPAAFLLGSALAGFAVGRLAKGLSAAGTGSSNGDGPAGGSTPAGGQWTSTAPEVPAPAPPAGQVTPAPQPPVTAPVYEPAAVPGGVPQPGLPHTEGERRLP